MSRGSRIRLITAPVAWEIMVKMVLPVDWRSRSKQIWNIIPTQTTDTMER